MNKFERITEDIMNKEHERNSQFIKTREGIETQVNAAFSDKDKIHTIWSQSKEFALIDKDTNNWLRYINAAGSIKIEVVFDPDYWKTLFIGIFNPEIGLSWLCVDYSDITDIKNMSSFDMAHFISKYPYGKLNTPVQVMRATNFRVSFAEVENNTIKDKDGLTVGHIDETWQTRIKKFFLNKVRRYLYV